jgi:hypothetical protein
MHVRDRLDLLPLRQAVVAKGDAALVFARQGLLDGLSRPDRYHVVGHGNGGQILAASEFALAEAQVVLRQAYGDLVTFGVATVHTYVDAEAGGLMVPVLFLRVDAPRCHMQELLDLLEARAARMKEVDVRRDRVVLRAEAEFSRALDLQRRVHALTDGSAHFLSWLLGYARAGQWPEAASLPRSSQAGIEERSTP